MLGIPVYCTSDLLLAFREAAPVEGCWLGVTGWREAGLVRSRAAVAINGSRGAIKGRCAAGVCFGIHAKTPPKFYPKATGPNPLQLEPNRIGSSRLLVVQTLQSEAGTEAL